jgi:hypothetical protein
VAVCEDEVDIHLNPKGGRDGMVGGRPKEVVTPGTNAKRSLAGAWEVRSGLRTWVAGERKARARCIALPGQVRAAYPEATMVHGMLDHDRIHDSQITQAALPGFGGRIRLHCLPPDSPTENRIGRRWADLPAPVTRSPTCRSMRALMTEVREQLWRRQRIRAGMGRRRVG